jgi:NAD(P)-dependent dehydrogenase (short-subunit alcohol dehydrogenase family)
MEVVVSSAGYGLFGAAEEVTDQVDRQINTNLIGSITLIRACLPHLRRPGFSLYHATKWGIEGFVEAVAKEVEPFGIRFTLVEPGPTGTNFGAGESSQEIAR